MTIQLDIHSFVRELKIVLSNKEGENLPTGQAGLQVCFPTKSAVKKKQVIYQRSIVILIFVYSEESKCINLSRKELLKHQQPYYLILAL
jgi:hypothetical protein